MKVKIKGMANHKEFLKRINKTLYYGQLPALACLSLPVTEVSCSVWSECQRGRSLRRLRPEQASELARGACVSPTALVLALLYVERLRAANLDYLEQTDPAHLFLVSLMVGNKYLEDNGEDDEVLISEWAKSGGIDEIFLKQLEIEFLQAIDWNIFVNENSFEGGLCWLEKEVALRQGRQRGFFTYTDLRVLSEYVSAATLADVVAATVALTAGYAATMVALLASALLVSQAFTPTTSPTSPQPETNMTNDMHMYNLVNSTLAENLNSNVLHEHITEQAKCCTKWAQYQERIDTPINWAETVIGNDWIAFESWWSKTSVLNWLYQSSLINPMQRWLEKLNYIGQLVRSTIIKERAKSKINKCSSINDRMSDHCFRQWLNLSKMGALMVSMSDR